MRLFLAIELPPDIKTAVWSVEQRLRQAAGRGSFTRRENLHLTLVFLGETPVSRVPQIRQAMRRASVKPFLLELEGLGRFRRQDGDIVWMGVQPNSDLLSLHSQLHTALVAGGFCLEKRVYSPHLTLGRRVQGIDPAAIPSGKILALVDSISLMESFRDKSGCLQYRAVATQKLEGAEYERVRVFPENKPGGSG